MKFISWRVLLAALLLGITAWAQTSSSQPPKTRTAPKGVVHKMSRHAMRQLSPRERQEQAQLEKEQRRQAKLAKKQRQQGKKRSRKMQKAAGGRTR